jgi:hypothetical protein
MTRLSNRSLLLTSVLTLTPLLSGITAVEGAGTEFPPAASVTNNRAGSSVTVTTQRQASDAAMNVTDLNPEEIVKLLQAEFDKNKDLLTPQHTAKDHDVVVFLGNTGAGKSTLINYLAGKDLRAEGSELVLSAPEDPDAMIIGTDMFTSETLYPRSIDVSIPGRPPLRFFDLPGLNDTDGSVRNLVNAALIRRVLLDAQPVRFVIVMGESQFKSDRGQSVISTLRGLNQLFELEGETQPLDRGMCVVTKENGLMTDIDAATRAFPLQVLRWRSMERIVPMYHARINDQNTAEHRQTLLHKIGALEPNKLTSVNVNSIYPPESIQALDRMYSRMFRDAYENKKTSPKTTVSEYEREIAAWRHDDFWQSFENNYFNEAYPSVRILRDISEESYRTSRDGFIGGHQVDRDAHILTLERMKNERIAAVKRETDLRSEQTLAGIKAEQGIDGVVPFDFANHSLYQERVCGREVLESITPDRKEHEIARTAFAKWISRYYQTQLDQQIQSLTISN